jgi:regulator of protease activity HflC (stomatin/prohibitin superfamily)
MLGFRYLKSPPTVYTILYRNGQAVRKGPGLSMFFFAPSATVVRVTLSSIDVPFVFEDTTSDFQDVTIQGQLAYRVAEPDKLVAAMNYEVDVRGRYVSDDPDKLQERLIQIAQVRAHAFAQKSTLAVLLNSAAELGQDLQLGLQESEVTKMLGIELISLFVLSVKSSPEMAKAMQADAREKLLLKADEAVFARRNTAIELERQIKENELNTERVIAEKQRQVREANMQADIAIETKKAELVDQQASNQRKLAAVQAEAIKGTLDAMQGSDWKTVMAALGKGDSKQVMAMAFQQLAENAEKIGRLDISPDLLKSILDAPSGKRS